MKKSLWVLIILIICLTFSASGFSEAINFSKYDDNELITLLDEIQNEIIKRGINRTANLPIGEYICGKEFPAGKYIVSFTMKEGMEACIWVYNPSYDKDDEHYTVFYQYFTHRDVFATYVDGEVYEYAIDIKEGDVLKVEMPVTLQVYNKILFK